MKKSDRNALIALPVVVLIAALVAVAGSQGGSTVGGFPVFALCVILAFVVQWVVFVPSYLAQTERFFDLTGSLTYITVAVVAVLLSAETDARSYLMLAMVVIWAARMGS
jgi:steroid 5-alpha reductase family enzyme